MPINFDLVGWIGGSKDRTDAGQRLDDGPDLAAVMVGRRCVT